ncbi:probable G-protein coupled receptor B0563.6 [Haliotis asinina]|uniref:probable G-protein coupled receptor B0563.6 n=1 Tax=Haliotis asinina TaxID=109174 RepID=UPI003531BEB0
MLAVTGKHVNLTTTSLPSTNTRRIGTTVKELNTEGNVEETTLMPTDTTPSDMQQHSACNSTFNCSSDPVTSMKDSVPEEKLLSLETYLAFQKYNDPVNVFLFMLALVLNGCNIVVFISQGRNSTNFYLIAISVMDILYVTCVMVKTVYYMTSSDFTTLFFSTYIIYIELYFKPVFQRTVFFLVFLVSVERLLVVVFPLKAKTFVFMRRPKSIIMMAFLIPSIYYIFSPFRYKIEATTDQTTNATVYPVVATHHDQAFLRAMSTAGNFIFVYALLLGGLLLNLLVVCALKRHSKKRQQLKTTKDTEKTARQERQTTVTIVTSCSVFLFLAFPHATNALVFSIIPGTYGPYGRYQYLFNILQDLGSTLTNLGLSTDFLAYIWLSTSFRTTFFRIVRIRQATTPTRYTDQNTGHTRTS